MARKKEPIEIVCYHNYMSAMQLGSLSAAEYNVLMAMCAKLKDRGTDELVFSYVDLKRLLQCKWVTNEEFNEQLKSTAEKLKHIGGFVGDERHWVSFILFTAFEYDLIEKTLKVSVNPKFEFVLNHIGSNFTRFELNEFVEVSGKYAKGIYRHLRQFRQTGIYRVTVEDLREDLGIPDTCPTYNIMEKIISPAVKELSPYFKKLKCTAIKQKSKGSPIKSFQFTFAQTPVEEIRQETLSYALESEEDHIRNNKKYEEKYQQVRSTKQRLNVS